METQDREWQKLTQQYATCARQFSEAVAGLGGRRDTGPEAVALWEQIKELHASCLPIEKEIDRYLGLDERIRERSAGSIETE